MSLDALLILGRGYSGQSVRTLQEAKSRFIRTGFLCHSHKDQEYVRGLVKRMLDDGIALYVDWLDTSMPSSPDRETAEKIQKKIVTTDFFLFLATPNSVSSTWCPWEIGYADGRKSLEKIFVIQTMDGRGTVYGNEYLKLYRRIDGKVGESLEYFEPGRGIGRKFRML